MRFIRSGNYSFPRVGPRLAVPRGEAIPPFWIEDGTIEVRWQGSDHPKWATPAERAAHRANLVAKRLPPPPYAITEDTTFGVAKVRGPNFEQAVPHSAIFTVAPGVRVLFESGNFTNVKIPDEVADEDVGNIQNAQMTWAPTGNARRPFVRVLAEDETTATFSAALDEEIASGRWDSHRRLGRVKEAARARRLEPTTRTADLATIVARNEAAIARIAALPVNGER